MSNQDGLGSKIWSGLAWSLTSRLVSQLSQLAVTIVLARLLVPADFGLIAMLSAVIGIAQLFMEMGLGSAIIQKKTVEQSELSSLFWVNLGTGIVLGGLFAAAAPLIADFYHQPALRKICLVLCPVFAISALNVVQYNVLRKEMQFRTLGVVDTVGVVVSGAAALVLASLGYGVWSLVWQQLLGAAVPVVALWIASRWRPSLTLDLAGIKDSLKFGYHLLGFNVLNYTSQNIDDVAVGRVFGAGALGEYSRAYELMRMPWRHVAGVVSRVMFPALSLVKDDDERTRDLFLRGVRYISLLSFPIMTLMAVLADVLVSVVLGPQWAGVAPILRILCPLGAMISVGTTVGWIYLSRGRSDLMLRWEIGSSFVRISGIMIGLSFGVRGVAIGIGTATALLFYPLFAVPGRLIGLRFGSVARCLLPQAGCALLLGAILLLVRRAAFDAGLPDGARLAILLSLGVAVYLAILQLTKIRAYTDLRELIRERLAQRKAPAA